MILCLKHGIISIKLFLQCIVVLDFNWHYNINLIYDGSMVLAIGGTEN